MILETLFAVSREGRDAAWVAAFYDAVPDAPLGDPRRMTGPDGFPYVALHLGAAGTLRDALDDCLRDGCGACVYASAGAADPEWVFRYGDLWSFRERGTFDPPVPPGGEGGQMLLAAPGDEVVPPYAREVLRRALAEIGAEPRVLMATLAGGRRLLVLPVEERFLDRLTWYIPRDLGLVSPSGWEGELVPL